MQVETLSSVIKCEGEVEMMFTTALRLMMKNYKWPTVTSREMIELC